MKPFCKLPFLHGDMDNFCSHSCFEMSEFVFQKILTFYKNQKKVRSPHRAMMIFARSTIRSTFLGYLGESALFIARTHQKVHVNVPASRRLSALV